MYVQTVQISFVIKNVVVQHTWYYSGHSITADRTCMGRLSQGRSVEEYSLLVCMYVLWRALFTTIRAVLLIKQFLLNVNLMY